MGAAMRGYGQSHRVVVTQPQGYRKLVPPCEGVSRILSFFFLYTFFTVKLYTFDAVACILVTMHFAVIRQYWMSIQHD